ncbi:MAG: 3-dehydroquinate synthase [Bacteroidetes bacterium]|nr:3-dehydroquinate synthase [Bacteroidota bacterium]
MTKKMHIVTVPLGDRSYPIYIGSGLLRQSGSIFQRHGIGRSIVIVSDTHVAELYLSTVEKSLIAKKFNVHSIILPPGEQQKRLNTADRIYTELLKRNIERSATIVALGGGVIGDLTGFIAATYLRGIGFVQIPTTLLAQVDSSVGGKVGINHMLAKNMIGAFYQPQFVLSDATVLRTLPKREMISGMGEIVKYGMILDQKFFRYIEQHLDRAFARDSAVLSHLIRKSCELKAYIVSNDEKEQHLRAILNFGHTIGHALEHAGHYGVLKHGEAILYGMVAEAHIAFRNGMISSGEKERLERLIQQLPLPLLTPIRLQSAALLNTMMKDKKTNNGIIRMPLPSAIGTVLLPSNVDRQFILDAIDYVKVYGS